MIDEVLQRNRYAALAGSAALKDDAMAITCAAKPGCHAAHMRATLCAHAAGLATLLLCEMH